MLRLLLGLDICLLRNASAWTAPSPGPQEPSPAALVRRLGLEKSLPADCLQSDVAPLACGTLCQALSPWAAPWAGRKPTLCLLSASFPDLLINPRPRSSTKMPWKQRIKRKARVFCKIVVGFCLPRLAN